MSTDKYEKIGQELIDKHVEFIPFIEVLSRSKEELDNTNPDNILSFGYEWMDEKMTGIFPGDLILIGGESGTGKTTFATNIAYKASKKHRVSVFALEDRPNNYGMNAIYFELGRVRRAKGYPHNYPWNAYRKNEIKDATYRELRDQAIENMAGDKKNLFFADVKVQMNIDMLEAAIDDQIQKGSKLFLIDHLHYFELGAEESTKADYIEKMMVRLKGIQNRTGAAIILIAHYRKMNGSKPNLDSFKDSIAIVQNANYVVNLWRDRSLKDGDDFGERFDTKIMVPKSRNPNGEFTVDVRFDPDTNDFINPVTSFGTPSNEDPKELSL